MAESLGDPQPLDLDAIAARRGLHDDSKPGSIDGDFRALIAEVRRLRAAVPVEPDTDEPCKHVMVSDEGRRALCGRRGPHLMHSDWLDVPAAASPDGETP